MIAVPETRSASASQFTPYPQLVIAVVEMGGKPLPRFTRATLSRLTSPESAAVLVSVNVWCPAPSWTALLASPQVSQLAVVGRLSARLAPPSTERVRVRVVFWPSPPTELAYRASNVYVPAVLTSTSADTESPVPSNPARNPDPV